MRKIFLFFSKFYNCNLFTFPLKFFIKFLCGEKFLKFLIGIPLRLSLFSSPPHSRPQERHLVLGARDLLWPSTLKIFSRRLWQFHVENKMSESCSVANETRLISKKSHAYVLCEVFVNSRRS